jgi:hypothetical protein
MDEQKAEPKYIPLYKKKKEHRIANPSNKHKKRERMIALRERMDFPEPKPTTPAKRVI